MVDLGEVLVHVAGLNGAVAVAVTALVAVAVDQGVFDGCVFALVVDGGVAGEQDGGEGRGLHSDLSPAQSLKLGITKVNQPTNNNKLESASAHSKL